ncbi:MAG: NAD(P)/FAD-dependent oxidoreductase [Legionellaceae bacterium]|nr:NAD(P)/FAD-dependent oxidoreductase [Legionellaceae bacterium]
MHVIIVGAGPTGLTAGVELARRGVSVEIIDKKKQGSTLSRAVGINPHSLKILEISGVTNKLLAEGIQYHTARFYHGAKHWVTLKLTAANPVQYGYNFMLGLPQDKTETILRDTFLSLGGAIHYDTELESITPQNKQVLVGTTQGKIFKGDYIIGADGAHSLTRELVGIKSKGIELPDVWSIADVEAYYPEDMMSSVALYTVGHGHIVFVAPIGKNRFRFVSNTKRVLDDVPFELDIIKIHREGEFKIKVAQVEIYRKGRVFLAGDAAHSHSPAGGRGMNLGIADAADLAEKLVQNKANEYTQSRYQEGKSIIAGSEVLRKILTASNPLKHFLVLFMLKIMTRIPLLQKKIASKFLYG